jgi:hypothetical protein
MKNGQNGQHDESPSQSDIVEAPLSLGWGNNRSATHIEVREIADMLLIETTLSGLEPASLVVTVQGSYFIVEGTITHSGGRGRYARYVAELLNARDDFIDVTYKASGELVLRLQLKGGSEIVEP